MVLIVFVDVPYQVCLVDGAFFSIWLVGMEAIVGAFDVCVEEGVEVVLPVLGEEVLL